MCKSVRLDQRTEDVALTSHGRCAVGSRAPAAPCPSGGDEPRGVSLLVIHASSVMPISRSPPYIYVQLRTNAGRSPRPAARRTAQHTEQRPNRKLGA